MNVQVNRIRRGDKVYEYCRLVKSYCRKEDGKPAVKVLANLGEQPEQMVANLKAAIKAAKRGEAVVPVSEARQAHTSTPEQGMAHTFAIASEMSLAGVPDELVLACVNRASDDEGVLQLMQRWNESDTGKRDELVTELRDALG